MLSDETVTTGFLMFAGHVEAALEATVRPGIRPGPVFIEQATRLNSVGVTEGRAAVRLRLELNRLLRVNLPEGSVFMWMTVGELCELLAAASNEVLSGPLDEPEARW